MRAAPAWASVIEGEPSLDRRALYVSRGQLCSCSHFHEETDDYSAEDEPRGIDAPPDKYEGADGQQCDRDPINERRAGKQVLNGTALSCVLLADADHLAVIGDNGKLLVFPVAELPEMPRGKGVKLQSYREGGLRDAAAFKADDGLTTVDASGRTRSWPEWREWLGRRAGAGKLAPKGFPATKRFRPK